MSECRHLGAESGGGVFACNKRNCQCVKTIPELLALESKVDVVACQGCIFHPSRIAERRRIRIEAHRVAETKIAEPVGTALRGIFHRAGLVQPANCDCVAWQNKMDRWGVKGCEENRAAIVAHLDEMAKQATWFNCLALAVRGYLTNDRLLSGAIKIASKVS